MNPPIYTPSGAAKEYGDYALNIYTGCPHQCFYCFAPQVTHKDRKAFHRDVRPRPGIVEATRKQLEKDGITGKLVHLCFTCDPYPMGCDTSTTSEIIRLLKGNGNHVQILTKNSFAAAMDIPLLDGSDWFGITLTGAAKEEEPNAADEYDRLLMLAGARGMGIKTWVSFEPVINAEWVLACLITHGHLFDKIKIGKLNYWPSDINWAAFGRRAEALCKERGYDYYIKDSLRAEMEAHRG